jgi:hypothetical protein
MPPIPPRRAPAPLVQDPEIEAHLQACLKVLSLAHRYMKAVPWVEGTEVTRARAKAELLNRVKDLP